MCAVPNMAVFCSSLTSLFRGMVLTYFVDVIIIIIIIISTMSFMQGIYPYIPETNNVPKEYNVTAILSLLFMVPISLVPVLTL
jgi:hypothetical protein